jgi:tetratricopeptide (TPR) repeat protein
MLFRWLSLALALAITAPASPLEDAIALYQARRYPEARAAFESIATAEPENAAAAYYLGMTLRRRGDTTALDDAVRWLAKAVEIEPGNATYLADFGGTSMQLANKNRSLSAATRGRDAMVHAIELDPDNLDARDGLMQFYAQAPFLVGGSIEKAYTQAEEIRKRDPQRGLVALIGLKLGEKKYADASALCEDTLKLSPDHYLALYHLGRIAALSGENLDRGLAALRHALELTPPPNSPPHSTLQFRIGNILEKQNDRDAARAAYEAALKLDSNNQAAADALAKLK